MRCVAATRGENSSGGSPRWCLAIFFLLFVVGEGHLLRFIQYVEPLRLISFESRWGLVFLVPGCRQWRQLRDFKDWVFFSTGRLG